VKVFRNSSDICPDMEKIFN